MAVNFMCDKIELNHFANMRKTQKIDSETNSLAVRVCPLCDLASERNETLVICSKCGLIYRTHAASAKEFGYWKAYLDDGREQKYDALRSRFYAIFWKVLCRLIRCRSVKPAILDVGCVPGRLLEQAVTSGWDIHGVELTAELCETTRRYCGATMWEGYIEEIDFGSQRFDLIVLSDVFRHIRRPREALRKCYEVLRPKGCIVIREINAANRRYQGRLANPCPFDMQFVTPDTIRRFLAATGFRSIQVRGSPMSLITTERFNALAKTRPFAYRTVLKMVNSLIAVSNPLCRAVDWVITPSFLGVGYKPFNFSDE